MLQVQVFEFLAQHNLRGQPRHRDIANLGNQRHGSRRAGIGLQNIDDVIGNGVLNVHQADDAELHGNFLCVFINGVDVAGRNADGRNHAGGIAGMDAGQFDMLHHRRNKRVRAVGNGVGFGFNGVFQKFVDQDRPLRCDVNGGMNIAPEHLLVMNHFHAASAQHVRGTNHQRIADAGGDLKRLFQIARHSGLGHGDAELVHHLPETVAVFRQIDGFGRRADDVHAGFRQFRRDIERRLSAELHDHAFGFFFFINA